MRRAVCALLTAFAFSVPWAYSVDLGGPFGHIARLIGLLTLFAAIAALLLTGSLRTPGVLQWLVLACLLWFCCTALWTIDEHATLVRLRALFQVMLPVWLVWEFNETPADWGDLLRAWVGGSLILAVLTIVSFASADLGTQFRFAATDQDPNDVARFLDLAFPMAALIIDGDWKGPWKLMAAIYIPAGLIGVLLTASRSGFVAAVVALAGCTVLLFRRHARILIAIFLPMVLGLWFVVPHAALERIATTSEQLQRGDLNQRLSIWAAGWQAFIRAPFIGSGAGTFVQAARLSPIDTAHNAALTMAVEGGVVALILVSAILVVCIRLVLVPRGSLRIALATAFTVCMVASLVATVEGNRTTWLLLGMISAAGRLTEEQPAGMARYFSHGPRRVWRLSVRSTP